MDKDFEKLIKILQSCMTLQQLRVSDKCHDNFTTKWSFNASLEDLSKLPSFSRQYMLVKSGLKINKF
jgi:hypothetical protein